MRKISLLSALLTLMLISSQGLFAQTIKKSASDAGVPASPASSFVVGGTVDATITQASDVGNGVPAQEFEAAYSIYDAEGADNFIIPAGPTGTTYSIVEATIFGSTSTGTNGGEFDINIYANAGTVPGALVYTESFNAATADPDADGDFKVTLSNCPALTQGQTYWIGVVGDRDFAGGGGQFFFDRSTADLAGNEGVWRNPGNGFATGCTDWMNINGCGVGGGAANGALGLAFELGLHLIPAPVVAVEPIPTMSEWGLMIFGLLVLNLSVFFLYKKQNAIG